MSNYDDEELQEQQESRNVIHKVPTYEYFKPNRQNLQPEGFDFDMNMFENLVDVWTLPDDIIRILRTTHADLDRFCKICYNMNFNQAYAFLTGITNAFMNRALKTLASCGNNTALNIVSKHFMGLDEEKESTVNVRFINDLKNPEEEQ